VNSKTLEYIEAQNLTSCLNNTKWKEFVTEINSIEKYEPLVNIKHIFDKENNGTFTPVWWNEVERDGFELIEWIQINPIKEEYIGTLAPASRMNYTEEIKIALKKHNIHFEFEKDIFIIYGYKRSN